jgi:hypothetical protein
MAFGGESVNPLMEAQQQTYKDFIKVMPQNIMYDRRVVRGNTFAALVIPVSTSTPIPC